MGAELVFHTNGQTGGHTERQTKLIVLFCNFANVPNECMQE